MTIDQAIWIGIVSGILASMAFSVLGVIYWKVIDPYLKTLLYNGSDIAGQWFAFPSEMQQNIEVVIIQKGAELKGRASFVVREGDKRAGYFEDIRSFDLKGQIKDRFVTINGTCPDRSRIGAINFLLEVRGDGRQLIGYTCFYSVFNMAVVHQAIVFTRDHHEPIRNGFFRFRRENAIYEARLIGYYDGTVKEEGGEKIEEIKDPDQKSLFEDSEITGISKKLNGFIPDDDLPF